MRHCVNENVQVYETIGENLGLLLIEAAGLVETHDGYVKVETQYDFDNAGYIVTAYLH